jgi:hypothetical protein
LTLPNCRRSGPIRSPPQAAGVCRLRATGEKGAAHASRTNRTVASERLARVPSRRPNAKHSPRTTASGVPAEKARMPGKRNSSSSLSPWSSLRETKRKPISEMRRFDPLSHVLEVGNAGRNGTHRTFSAKSNVWRTLSHWTIWLTFFP